MILVLLSPEDGSPFSPEDVLMAGRNIQRVLSGSWNRFKVTPFISTQRRCVVGLRVKPFGAATHALTVLPCLQQVDFAKASEL